MESLIAQINFQSVYAEIVIAFVAIILLMLQALFPNKSKNIFGYLSLLGIFIAALCISFDFQNVMDSVCTKSYSFSGMWVIDNYSRFFKLLFLLCTGLTILISIKYVKEEDINHGEYFTLILFSTLGMMIMASGSNFVTIFLGIELMSICLYALAGIKRERLICNEASLKYFLLGSFATGFLLYGMALFYGAIGSTNLNTIAKTCITGNFQNPTILIGTLLLFIGFAFKIAAVPFHMWTPDVYQGSPSPITGFMSAGPKAAAFAALVRIFLESLPSLRSDWSDMIWIIAVLTMSLGNFAALVQNNVKRMLAYSSIAHVGYILVAFLSSGTIGISSILYYLLAYTFMNLGAFAIITVVGGKGEEKTNIEDFVGFGYSNPLTAITMSLFLFSLAGIPPTAGFMGKFYIFTAAIKEGFLGIAIIGVINSVVSVYYYLRITIAMYMKENTNTLSNKSTIKFNPAVVIAIIVSVYGVLRMGLFPSDYIEMAQRSLIALQ